MEIKFNRTTIPYMQSVFCQTELQEQTQQIRISENMPDMDMVLCAWGQIILSSKAWHSDNIQVSGGTTVNVLYMSVDKELKCVDAWIPFQISVDIPESQRDGAVTVRPFVRSVEAKMISDRKISVHTVVGLSIDARVPNERYVCTPEDVSTEVQILHNTYHFLLPVEMGEKQFTLEEPLDIENGNDSITILRQALELVLTESKIIADKLVLRGDAELNVLYKDESGRISKLIKSIPFSQYAQLDGEYESKAIADIAFAITECDLEYIEQKGYTMRAGVLAQYTIYDGREISVAEDAYLPKHNIEMESEQLEFPSVLSLNETVVEAEVGFPASQYQTLDIAMCMEDMKPEFKDNTLLIRPGGTFRVLSVDDEGNYNYATYRWESSWQVDAAPNIAADIFAVIEGTPKIQGNRITAPLHLKLISTNTCAIPMICNIELGSPMETDANRPSLIVRKMGDDTLWQLAKSTGSTIDAIMKANNLQQEPSREKLLLIPIV